MNLTLAMQVIFQLPRNVNGIIWLNPCFFSIIQIRSNSYVFTHMVNHIRQ